MHGKRSLIPLKMAVVGVAGGLAVLSESWGPASGIHRVASRLAAVATGRVVEFLGMPAYVDGTSVYGLGYSIRVVAECDALAPAVVGLTGVALLGVSLRRKLELAALGLVLAFVLNVLRLSTVLTVGTRSQATANVLHEVVFPGAWIAVFAVLWFAWLNRLAADEALEAPAERPVPAGAAPVGGAS